MNKKINFTDQELTDIQTVLKIVEPEIGIGPGRLYRIYDVVFSKSYESKLGFTMDYIDADKCYIKIGDRKITAREITDELIDRKVIVKFKVTRKDENECIIYRDSKKTWPLQQTLYKTIL